MHKLHSPMWTRTNTKPKGKATGPPEPSTRLQLRRAFLPILLMASATAAPTSELPLGTIAEIGSRNYTDTYKCGNFTNDLVTTLKNEYNITAVCGYHASNHTTLHAWAELNLDGRIVLIDAVAGKLITNESPYNKTGYLRGLRCVS